MFVIVDELGRYLTASNKHINLFTREEREAKNFTTRKKARSFIRARRIKGVLVDFKEPKCVRIAIRGAII